MQCQRRGFVIELGVLECYSGVKYCADNQFKITTHEQRCFFFWQEIQNWAINKVRYRKTITASRHTSLRHDRMRRCLSTYAIDIKI